jgi:dsDNA-specific endonuclease/ATPase MutS2
MNFILYLSSLSMTTHFIIAEVNLQGSPNEMKRAIESELRKWGEPLRWAITKVNKEQQKMIVEAIVTTA